jgi:hypothetical protein
VAVAFVEDVARNNVPESVAVPVADGVDVPVNTIEPVALIKPAPEGAEVMV